MKDGKHAVMTIPCNQFSGWLLFALDAATEIRMEQNGKGFVKVKWDSGRIESHFAHSLFYLINMTS